MSTTLIGPRHQDPIRIVCIGLGGIGQKLLAKALSLDEFNVVAAVDPLKPEIEGVNKVESDIANCDGTGGDVAVVATGSNFLAVQTEIHGALDLGLHVVSTCEELSYPWDKYADDSAALDRKAVELGLTVVGCGVNPGFVMDALPVALLGASVDTRYLKVTRLVNLENRRPQLREKMGVGLPEWQWNDLKTSSGFGHTGLVESLRLCAIGLGWIGGRMEFTREPLIRNGMVRGVAETATLTTGDERDIILKLAFEMKGEDVDIIEFDGTPAVRVVFEGGLAGDAATLARALNCARVVKGMKPGLRLPTEVPGWTRA